MQESLLLHGKLTKKLRCEEALGLLWLAVWLSMQHHLATSTRETQCREGISIAMGIFTKPVFTRLLHSSLALLVAGTDGLLPSLLAVAVEAAAALEEAVAVGAEELHRRLVELDAVAVAVLAPHHLAPGALGSGALLVVAGEDGLGALGAGGLHPPEAIHANEHGFVDSSHRIREDLDLIPRFLGSPGELGLFQVRVDLQAPVASVASLHGSMEPLPILQLEGSLAIAETRRLDEELDRPDDGAKDTEAVDWLDVARSKTASVEAMHDGQR